MKVEISKPGLIVGKVGDIRVIDCQKKPSSKGREKGKDVIEGTCSAKIEKDKVVSLVSAPSNVNYRFATWADACQLFYQGTSCQITMDGNKTVSANFNLIEGGNIDVSVRKTGLGFGKVVSIEDSKINCGSKCSGSYESKFSTLADHGGEGFEYASFKAVPERGSSFVGWRGGDCLKSTRKDMRKYINVCYVTLSGGNKIIVADFSEGSKNPGASILI